MVSHPRRVGCVDNLHLSSLIDHNDGSREPRMDLEGNRTSGEVDGHEGTQTANVPYLHNRFKDRTALSA